ncbi:ribosomal protein S18-alanine N-acetyltransferase [Nocardioides mesophilus]|uniref:[Ribosomal protein bS18]-alanine N-acetyltransferase n=1 Tax=Nocardioides mesophilus TaxID=433659 RepID=A0A7G9R782_9ACTN|nr:ribosomal protein S18-alanine N-acetyltransferase [Nocardioides mesophilus]QNN51457.1 ribosomal protein S18-alanine N-acetyltransferase [Nocardioides mesophilus]
MTRAAGPADVAAVVRLEQELFGPDAWSEPQVREELLGARRRSWVALAGPAPGRVVGYAVTLRSGDVADLQRIGVDPAHRRRGLARALLAGAVDAAAADGAVRLLLEVSAGNAAAIGFYAAVGFAPIARRRRYYRDGSDALVMERPLRS